MFTLRISTRLVLVFRTFVIKIPLGVRGYLQAKNEKVLWEKYSTYRVLGKMHWEFLGVVCQKKYEEVRQVPAAAVLGIKKLIPELNFENCDLYNHQNWCKHHDQYILVDYGNNPFIASLY